MMNFIHCGSHLPLLFALSLKNKGKEITVISFSEDVIKYCAEESINHIKLDYIRPTVTSIHKVYALKKMLDDMLSKIDFGKKNNYFLTGRVKSYDALYLAKEFSKRGCKVYYTNTIGIDFKRFKPIFIRGLFIRFAFKRILDLDLQYYTGRDVPFVGVNDEFFKKYNIIDYPLDYTHEELIAGVAKNIKSKRKPCKNLIVDQGSFGDILKVASMEKLYKNLLEIPIEYTFKGHPRPTEEDSYSDLSVYKMFKDCNELPRHVPAELMLNNIQNSVISVYSAVLITASSFKHLKSISLLELVDWCNVSFKSRVKLDLIKKSNNKILFPSSFEELNSMLNQSSEK